MVDEYKTKCCNCGRKIIITGLRAKFLNNRSKEGPVALFARCKNCEGIKLEEARFKKGA